MIIIVKYDILRNVCVIDILTIVYINILLNICVCMYVCMYECM